MPAKIWVRLRSTGKKTFLVRDTLAYGVAEDFVTFQDNLFRIQDNLSSTKICILCGNILHALKDLASILKKTTVSFYTQRSLYPHFIQSSC